MPSGVVVKILVAPSKIVTVPDNVPDAGATACTPNWMKTISSRYKIWVNWMTEMSAWLEPRATDWSTTADVA